MTQNKNLEGKNDLFWITCDQLHVEREEVTSGFIHRECIPLIWSHQSCLWDDQIYVPDGSLVSLAYLILIMSSHQATGLSSSQKRCLIHIGYYGRQVIQINSYQGKSGKW
jgi:hypothetical protein